MKWLLFVMMMIICILLLICYSLMVMAHDADERADEMFKKWQSEKHERTDCPWK